MKKLSALALFGVLLAGAAIAALPYVSAVNPTDAIQIVVGGASGVSNRYATPAQITATQGYQKVVPTGTITYTQTLLNSQSTLEVLGPITMAYDYVVLASNPSDGTQQCVFSKSAITALWLTAGTSTQTLANAATSLSANSKTCMLYSASNATWDRSQ